MAWAEKMPSGRYRGGYRSPGGKKRYISNNGKGFERKTDAREAAQEAEVRARRRAAIDHGTQSARITWGEWWDLFAENRYADDTDTGITEKQIVKKYLRPKWGAVPLNKIPRQGIKRWVWDEELKVRPGMSPGYARRIFGVFRASLAAATEGDRPLLEVSPCAGIPLPKVARRAKPYLTVANTKAIGAELREDYRDALEFDLETGLRPGEICGLHADRVDLDRGWLLVAEVFVTHAGVIRGFPKDDDARLVPLTDNAIEIIRRRLAGRDLTAACPVPHSDGRPCRSPLVFLTVRGRAMRPNSLWARMKLAAAKAGVDHRSPYAGRRGFATRAAEGGLDAFQIAEILGHSTLTQAQEYVQQTDAARMKLTVALSTYPQLVMLDGLGQETGRGAEHGAQSARDHPDPTVIRDTRDTG